MGDLIFNEAEYLAANLDVAAAVKECSFLSGYEHYEKLGKSEGRMQGGLPDNASREEKVFYFLDRTGLELEIGLSHNPIAPKKKEFNVHILDHASADQLREKYAGHEIHGVKVENIEEVDFACQREPFQELIDKNNCYDWIIASHLIEHVPNMI